MAETNEPKNNRGRKIRAYSALALIVIAVILAGLYYYRQYTKYYSTDDAYIDADKVAVSAKILGRITEIKAVEGDTVKTGQLLVLLDSSDLVSQRIQAIAQRDQYIAALHQSEARSELDIKNALIQDIALSRAKEDLDRATMQFEGKVISKEQYDHLKKAYESTQAQVDAARAQLAVGKSQVESSRASIKTSEAQMGMVETQLRNTRIYAPCSGRIAKRWLLPGDIVQPGQSVFTITRDSVKWVLAFFEETKVGGIRDGQQAEFTVDAFPDVKFYGSVYNISTNTAAQFSLIPPNNASGNFTKVTQRIPLKISINRTDSKDPSVIQRLVSGMSVVVRIYK